jgi:hypothetical protein
MNSKANTTNFIDIQEQTLFTVQQSSESESKAYLFAIQWEQSSERVDRLSSGERFSARDGAICCFSPSKSGGENDSDSIRVPESEMIAIQWEMEWFGEDGAIRWR